MNLEKEIEEINKYKGKEVLVYGQRIGILVEVIILVSKHLRLKVKFDTEEYGSNMNQYYLHEVTLPGKRVFLFKTNKNYEV